MAKIEKVIKVSEDMRDLIQRAHIEYYQKDKVVKGLIEDHQYDDDPAQFLESKIFKLYEDRTAKALLAYETLTKDLEQEYCPQELRGKNYQWTLDYNTCELTYREQ